MREVIIKKEDGNTTVVIRSPWLSREAAALYLDISLSEFLRTVADNCPHRRFGNRRKYNVKELDNFLPAKEVLNDESAGSQNRTC